MEHSKAAVHVRCNPELDAAAPDARTSLRRDTRIAALAPALSVCEAVATSWQNDSFSASVAERRRERRRVFQLLEIERVRRVPGVHLGLELRSAPRAARPITGVLFMVMKGAESLAIVVSVAAIPSVRENDVFVFIVADPVVAAFRADELLRCLPT